jgi:hypothetical protein
MKNDYTIVNYKNKEYIVAKTIKNEVFKFINIIMFKILFKNKLLY